MTISNKAGRRQHMACPLEKLGSLGRGCLIIGALATASPGMAQQSVPFTPATLDTMAVTMARHRQVLAADSMQLHISPDAALERTAQYVATEFTKLRLEPRVARDGAIALRLPPRDRSQGRGWVQRYPVPQKRPIDYAASTVTFFASQLTDAKGSPIVDDAGNGVIRSSTLSLARDARLSGGEWGSGDVGEDAILIAGPHTLASLRNAAVRSRPAIFVPSPTQSDAARREIIDYLVTVCEGVIVVEDVDSATFATTLEASNREQRPVRDTYIKQAFGAPSWVVHMRREALAPQVARAGIDLTHLPVDTASLKPAPGLYIALTLSADSSVQTETAPNVFGVIAGSDSALKQEYVMISAPMVSGDTAAIDRDALAALLALAEELSRPDARPKRSILFAATSAVEEGGSGSAFLAAKLPGRVMVVANVYLNPRGHAGGDTIVVDGASDMDRTVPLAWVTAQHPEIQLVARPGTTAVRPETNADALVFVRRMTPTLVFNLPSSHQEMEPSDAGTSLKAPLTARANGLVYLVSHTLATAPQRPWWTGDARRQFLQLVSPP